MEPIEKQLLGNVFDALDRLFDSECGVIDVHAILYASEMALKTSSLPIELTKYETELRKIIQSGEGSHAQRDKALDATNDLREKLNELLPI